MKNYFKYFLIIWFVMFSFYYTDKVTKISEQNNVIMTSINDYALKHDSKCIEGSITEDGVILGLSGISVNKNKSYSNMKGIGFDEKLIEYNNEECILSTNNNYDKYIVAGNSHDNNVGLVIDVNSCKYFSKMLKIAENKEVSVNLLFNYETLNKYIESINNHSNILFKGKTRDELNNYIKILHDEFYCTNRESDVIDICKSKKLNSINVINYIDKNLLLNTKKILNKGSIVFIKENEFNMNELSSTINYIKSRGYNIVSIDELLS